ncbi:hypothetical protein [Symmachiella dynata]|uniref:hypothetical protein n=1 Tax=Symmachiella dynata TaxID=2527995 RepID=UPI0030EB8E9D
MIRCCLLFTAVWLSTTFAEADDPKSYFGLQQGHTSYSDGSGNPEEAITMAKQAALDFLPLPSTIKDRRREETGYS